MSDKTAATLVKTYNINIRGADLQVQKLVIEKLITSMADLKLTAAQGFKAGQPTSGFKLEFKDNSKQTKFNTLITMLKTVVTMHFFATNKEGEPLSTFTADEATFLELHLGDLICTRIAIGIPES